MKKILSMLLAVIIMFSATGISVYATDTADVVIVGSEVIAKPGETVEIPIVIEKNNGFCFLQLQFQYPGELTLVSFTNAVSALACTSDATTVWDGEIEYTGTGNLAILTFTVSENAEHKAYPVTINFIESYDYELNDVSASLTAGSIKVVCPYSDATNDHIDADGDWESDSVKHFHTCRCGTTFDSAAHSGGSASCKEKAKCETCGLEYGTLEAHTYIAEKVKSEALVTAGNCRDEAVYYYSCSGCGLIEGNANHTFKGEKVATDHVGGTTIVNASAANHTTQTDGYTGDTKCQGCNQITVYGQTIPADAHTPAANWSTDGTYHWKECAVSGCNVVIGGTKDTHYSNKAENKATCQKTAICDVCDVTYGTVVAHNWATTYNKDASGHWHDCQTLGCTEKNGFAAHTPDHQGSATEEYAIKCVACQYVIEAQLAHTHIYDKEIAKDEYKASDATCDKAATYYKSCKCGVYHSNDTFSYGTPNGHAWAEATCTVPKACRVCKISEGTALGHIEGTEWKNNSSEHWHICARTGCDVVIESSKGAHIPDREEANENGDVKCTECGYVIATHEPPHYHEYRNEWQYNNDEHWNECDCSDRASVTLHSDVNLDGKCDICGYGVPVPENVTAPTAPKTGDNSMVWMWIALVTISGLGLVALRVRFQK